MILSFLFFDGKSQTDFPKKNAVVLDLAGIGGYGSLNYQRIFFSKNNFIFSGKFGFSFFRFRDYERKLNPDLLFPFSLQVNKNWKSHSIIFGVGQTVSSIVQASENFDKKIRNNGWSGSLIIGYQFQKMNSPFFFQIAFTPLFEHYERFRNWGGLSIGYFF